MIGLDAVLYSFVCGAMLVVSVLGFESAAVTPSLDRWDRRFFTAFFASLAVGSSTFFLELAAYVFPSLMALLSLAYLLQSTLLSVPFPMLAAYLLHCCGEDRRGNLFFRAVMVFWALYCILLVIAMLAPRLFFYVEPGFSLHFGVAYPALIALLFLMLLLVAVGVIRRRGKLSRQYYRAFLVCLLPVTFAVSIHVFVPVFTLIDVGLTISAFSMYRIIVTDSIERDRQHQQELANQRASIAVLQMRPHFIYNTMTTIYYLCDQDPALAKQVTMDFTAYLRRNLSAIAGTDVIPFSEELEHTRAYLAVEQAQFEDALVVNYDTPHIRFRVPPLTLQPIVENAVKHGMDPDLGPLSIWVRTTQTETGSEVVVEDDGIGFDPAIAEEGHSTLANIRQRLEMMCGGTLDITSRTGGGTVVKLTVPQQE